MAITNNSSFVPTMNLFLAHFTQCNAALAPGVLLIPMPDNTTLNKVQFDGVRNGLLAQQTVVQGRLNDQQIARGDIDLQKVALLVSINLFNEVLDAFYAQTKFIGARPRVPGFNDGPENFTRPLVDAMTLWEKINAAAAPAGVVLPLVLANGTAHGSFASAISTLQFAYLAEGDATQNVALARTDRNLLQEKAYTAMKSYRLAVPAKLALHPNLVETLPVLTPAPGHTPVPVNASALFQAPDEVKVVYGASADPDLLEYQLRGTVGDKYEEDDAIVIASHGPGDAREFMTAFGLTQPGATVALKLYVVLTTGNESGSAAMVVRRPALAQPLAA